MEGLEPCDWLEAWAKRKEVDGSVSELSRLLILSGAKRRAGTVMERDYRDSVKDLAERIGINKRDSVFEVGCGPGAFIYSLHELFGVEADGLDASPFLVETARKALPFSQIARLEAVDCPVAPPYDHVFSSGVFYYFPNYDYAERVFRRMYDKARKSVAVLTVADMERRDEAEEYRRAQYPAGEYERLYSKLKYLYFDKKWFRDLAKSCGGECEIFHRPVANYMQSEFRFHVIVRKTR